MSVLKLAECGRELRELLVKSFPDDPNARVQVTYCLLVAICVERGITRAELLNDVAKVWDDLAEVLSRRGDS